MVDQYNETEMAGTFFFFQDQEEHIKGENGEEIKPLILWTLMDWTELVLYHWSDAELSFLEIIVLFYTNNTLLF